MRSEGTRNPSLLTGEVEVAAGKADVLNLT